MNPSTKKDTTQQTLVNMGLLSSFSITETVFHPPPPPPPTTSRPPIKFKMESIGIPPAHDDDWDQCPARTRTIWPKQLVPWWQPNQPTDKPPYTYATLVAFAILISPDGRLLLNDIYRWISQTYPYYVINQRGWQNSIRHNLSLNKQWFQKVDRRPTQANPGKGCYWTLVPGSEQAFIDTITHGSHDTTIGTTTTMKITRPHDYNPHHSPVTTKPPVLGPMYTTFRMTTGNPKRKRQPQPQQSNKRIKKVDDDAQSECDSGVDVGCLDNDINNKKTMALDIPVEYNILDHFLDQLPLPDQPLDGFLDYYPTDDFFYLPENDVVYPTLLTSSFEPAVNKDFPLVIHLNGDDIADQYLTFDDEDDKVSLGLIPLDPIIL
ncbi:fork head domain-containing protein [Chlamydoabsidia padenii]|nr:fork head domain-containing protein [Chlamydoabsidia padenii]